MMAGSSSRHSRICSSTPFSALRMLTKQPSLGHWAVILLNAMILSGSTVSYDSGARCDGAEPMSLEGLFQLERVADPQLSPDGSKVVYQVTKILDASKNQKATQLWLANADGSGSRPLTTSGKSDTHPRWSPDGTKILFESTRDGASQLYVLDLAAGGEPRKVTQIATGASNGIWSPDGGRIAFLSTVRPEWSIFPLRSRMQRTKMRTRLLATLW